MKHHFNPLWYCCSGAMYDLASGKGSTPRLFKTQGKWTYTLEVVHEASSVSIGMGRMIQNPRLQVNRPYGKEAMLLGSDLSVNHTTVYGVVLTTLCAEEETIQEWC